MAKNKIKQISWQVGVPLARVTSFGLGGSAKWFAQVGTAKELLLAYQEALTRNCPVIIISGASNLVWTDKNFFGSVIRFWQPRPRREQWLATKRRLEADASVPLDWLVSLANRLGLGGLEKLAGIPGTIGGAVVGNAGAYGRSIGELVEAVEIFDGRRIRWIEARACRFGYRESVFKLKSKWVVLHVRLKMEPAISASLQKESRQIRRIREEKYPSNLRCPGSFFKNIEVKKVAKNILAKIDQTKIIGGKIPAGYLLEEVGAKGMKEGGIRVAKYHGNLLFNNGRGTSLEVKKISQRLKALVKKKFGIELEEEVRMIDT